MERQHIIIGILGQAVHFHTVDSRIRSTTTGRGAFSKSTTFTVSIGERVSVSDSISGCTSY